MSNHFLTKLGNTHKAVKADAARWSTRAAEILNRCNPVQKNVLLDTSTFKSILCPRRAGKSYSITSNALYIGEDKPNSRILIISLNLKSTKENFWGAAPGGVFDQNKANDLKLTFNNTEYTWTHENGSRGRLAGADTRADIESFRGASAEADAIFIDEAGSFAPDLLRDLIFDVLMPGLMTRGGFICLAGTPGLIPNGLFYEATSVVSRVTDEENQEVTRPTCAVYEDAPQPEESALWSLHKWSVKDNEAAPAQWKRALRIKKARNLTDESPSWRREFLGEWVTDPSELVYYGYLENRDSGRVTWNPQPTIANPSGLPEEGAPWELVMGVDLGFEDDSAITYSGWSSTANELRPFFTFKSPHMNVDDLGEKILEVISIYGVPSVIVGDKGALGKMIVETINSRYGINIIAADKSLKSDHQELLNTDFQAGRIKIPINSDLDDELCTLQWELTKDKVILVRTGKLREDPKCANHLCDCLLYTFRYCYHFFASSATVKLAKNSTEWFEAQEREAIRRLQEQSVSSSSRLEDKFKELRRNDRNIFAVR